MKEFQGEWQNLYGNLQLNIDGEIFNVGYYNETFVLNKDGKVYSIDYLKLEDLIFETLELSKQEILRYTIIFNDKQIECDNNATAQLLDILDISPKIFGKIMGDDNKTDQRIKFVNKLGLDFEVSVDEKFILPQWDGEMRIDISEVFVQEEFLSILKNNGVSIM